MSKNIIISVSVADENQKELNFDINMDFNDILDLTQAFNSIMGLVMYKYNMGIDSSLLMNNVMNNNHHSDYNHGFTTEEEILKNAKNTHGGINPALSISFNDKENTKNSKSNTKNNTTDKSKKSANKNKK